MSEENTNGHEHVLPIVAAKDADDPRTLQTLHVFDVPWPQSAAKRTITQSLPQPAKVLEIFPYEAPREIQVAGQPSTEMRIRFVCLVNPRGEFRNHKFMTIGIRHTIGGLKHDMFGIPPGAPHPTYLQTLIDHLGLPLAIFEIPMLPEPIEQLSST